MIGESGGAGQVVWFEIGMPHDMFTVYPEFRCRPLPVYPGSWQDYSILWSMEQGFTALTQRLTGFRHPLLQGCEFVTVYKGKGMEPGLASYTFRCRLGADHTLSESEIDAFRADWLAFLTSQELKLRG